MLSMDTTIPIDSFCVENHLEVLSDFDAMFRMLMRPMSRDAINPSLRRHCT